jgi:hypothetical protein
MTTLFLLPFPEGMVSQLNSTQLVQFAVDDCSWRRSIDSCVLEQSFCPCPTTSAVCRCRLSFLFRKSTWRRTVRLYTTSGDAHCWITRHKQRRVREESSGVGQNQVRPPGRCTTRRRWVRFVCFKDRRERRERRKKNREETPRRKDEVNLRNANPTHGNTTERAREAPLVEE